jgi:predicted kinase
MSGVPGAGKSTIARAVAHHRPFTILDHDVVKTALLQAGISFDLAGAASYKTILALAGELLSAARSVIIDSPCLYAELLAAGQNLAERHQASYRYIECVADDLPLLDRRLRARQTMRSQRPSVAAMPADAADHGGDATLQFQDWIRHMKRPTAGYLRLDTTRSVDACVRDAIVFIDNRQPPDSGRASPTRRR